MKEDQSLQFVNVEQLYMCTKTNLPPPDSSAQFWEFSLGISSVNWNYDDMRLHYIYARTMYPICIDHTY